MTTDETPVGGHRDPPLIVARSIMIVANGIYRLFDEYLSKTPSVLN
jgi:hypothetical protein